MTNVRYILANVGYQGVMVNGSGYTLPELTDTRKIQHFSPGVRCWQFRPPRGVAAVWDASGKKIAQADTVFLPYRSVRSRGSCCCVRRSAVVLSTCSALGSLRCQRANSSAMSVPQVGQLL